MSPNASEEPCFCTQNGVPHNHAYAQALIPDDQMFVPANFATEYNESSSPAALRQCVNESVNLFAQILQNVGIITTPETTFQARLAAMQQFLALELSHRKTVLLFMVHMAVEHVKGELAASAQTGAMDADAQEKSDDLLAYVQMLRVLYYAGQRLQRLNFTNDMDAYGGACDLLVWVRCELEKMEGGVGAYLDGLAEEYEVLMRQE